MSDDYLWEGKGKPDPEVERLERLLGGLRYTGEAPSPPRRRGRRLLLFAAVAACLLLALGIALRSDPGTPDGPGWRYETGDGRVAALGVGEWLETGAQDRARLDVADIGRLDIRPGSRLQLLATGDDEHRLHLQHGSVHAFVVAPPRLFVIETPVTTAVDLGCEYTLDVDPDGNGQLAVTLGYVALERNGREVKVPHGARCRIREGHGAGTPWFEDASQALRDALDRFDTGGREAIADIRAAARARDTLTLWNLLPDVDEPTRAQLLDRILEFHPLPAGLTREGVLALDRAMLDDLWTALERAVWYS